MTGHLSAWLVALTFAAVMLSLGMNLGMLAKPTILNRCGACGRLVRRGRVCPCSRPREN
jgi:hypothetical protein